MAPILRNSDRSRRPLSAAINTVSGLMKRNMILRGDEFNKKNGSGVKQPTLTSSKWTATNLYAEQRVV